MDDELEAIATTVVDAAFSIHTRLGPGLLECVYSTVLAKALEKRGLWVQREVAVPIVFDGIQFDEGFRADLIVNQRLLIELKSVERMAPVHAKQVLTYLRLLNFRLGFLINFGSALFRDGVTRIAN